MTVFKFAVATCALFIAKSVLDSSTMPTFDLATAITLINASPDATPIMGPLELNGASESRVACLNAIKMAVEDGREQCEAESISAEK